MKIFSTVFSFLSCFLLGFLFSLNPQQLKAQPDGFHTCHHHKNQIPLHPLTETEIAAMTSSNERSDTIDILNFSINLDVTDFSGKTISGTCEIRFTPKMDQVERIELDLLEFNIDSVLHQGNLLAYDYDGLFLTVTFPSMNIGDTMTLEVAYHGQPVVDPSFGGFEFISGIAYNLGIGLTSNPYNYGRGWFPCFDNFVERATYDLNIISSNNRRAYGIGTFLGEEDLGNGKILRKYSMTQPLPTYLVGVAVGEYEVVEQTHTGAFGDIPIELIAKPADVAPAINAFQYLGDAIDAFEHWFGPYIWERVGYVMTVRGAMEHCTNIAYPVSVIAGGADANQNGLMAHELGHHWWGNVTTLSSPANMWIKEGNAEYASHLFTEWTFGREAFVNEVKSNLEFVLTTAHVNDGAFLPLANIPFENTYGRHTYYKGASMMHNLRTYLGDDLFRSSMSSMLVDLAFQSVNAEQFRDYLIDKSGVDLNPFFDAWIFNPGYSNFEINEVEVTSTGSDFEVTVEVEQKLRGASELHTQVPLEITFFAEDWTMHVEPFMASGEFTTATFTLPFEPAMQILNDAHKLNLGRLQNRVAVYSTGDVSRNYIDFVDFEVTELADSALLNVVHHWVAPDKLDNNPFDVRMSNTHYWTISGVVPDQFKAKATLRYDGADVNALDFDLTNTTEDSLILMYRPSPDVAWVEHPHYKQLAFGTTDGKGFMRIDSLWFGEYAFANGSFPVSTEEVIENQDFVEVFPNPTTENVFIKIDVPELQEATVELFDLTGKLLSTKSMNTNNEIQEMNLNHLTNGTYILKLTSADVELMKPQKLLILK